MSEGRNLDLRSLPAVDTVLREPALGTALAGYSRAVVTREVRRELARYRADPTGERGVPSAAEIARGVSERLETMGSVGPSRLINATGVVLHTNLGRAPLARVAVDAMVQAASYADLEYETLSGARGSRQEHVRSLLRALLPAEEAFVTVNAASAILLTLASVARRKEVLVSRGQAVEIGGGFRIPTILQQSGARLVEVGTTNRTSVEDYADAIGDRTACILHVHASNFQIVGFTAHPELDELAALARSRGVLLVSDNGSGSLLDTARFGLAHEPTPAEALEAGADAVTFSGDKLLGGPQAGIVVGSAAVLQRIARHPLARALRPDKTILAGLNATLLCYLQERAVNDVPVWGMIAEGVDNIRARAQVLAARAAARGVQFELIGGESAVGGGSLPGSTLPTILIRLPKPLDARALRTLSPPVIARTRGDRALLDLRTVASDQEDQMLAGILDLCTRPNPPSLAGAG